MNRQEMRVWHPFTQAMTAPAPLKVVRGEGSKLYLEDGREVVDLISSWWVNLHGHGRPEIAEAIYRQALQLEHVIFAGFTHEPAEQYSSDLLDLLNSTHVNNKQARVSEAQTGADCADNYHQNSDSSKSFAHVFFSDNGSTAVEVAMKMAFQYWQNMHRPQKTKFVCFEGGYHGDTIGAMSAGGASPFWSDFKKLMFEVEILRYPCTFEGDREVLETEGQALLELRSLLERDSDKLAAILIEPLVQGAGGMRMCRPEFLRSMCTIAREFEVLIIFDEVMTGFGRTGDWFALTKSGTRPDIVCLSKGITGGFMPLSATACTSAIYDAFLSDDWKKMLMHGHSYTANPIALSAAGASLALLKDNQTAFADMEALHRRFFHEHLSGIKHLVRSRFCGTIFACDIEVDQSGYFNSVSPILREQFLSRGLLIRPLGNTIYLLPPYCIGAEELEAAYITMADVLSSLPVGQITSAN